MTNVGLCISYFIDRFVLEEVSCHRISTKQELEKEVAEIGDWETLCEYLGVHRAVLNGLRYSSMQNRRKKSECLAAYIDSGQACWEHIVEVVAGYPFYNKRLTRKIADLHAIEEEGKYFVLLCITVCK